MTEMKPVKKYQDRQKIHCDGLEKNGCSQHNASNKSFSVRQSIFDMTLIERISLKEQYI